jgi:secreted trypsin-like serine protease
MAPIRIQLKVLVVLIVVTSIDSAPALERHREYDRAMEHWLAKDQDANKILRGEEVAAGTHEWQVPILRADIPDNFYSLFCSGVRLRSGWILTAAHCVFGLKPSAINILQNTLRLDGSGRRVEIDAVLTHPRYDEESMLGDVALLHTHGDTAPVIKLADQAIENTALRPGSRVFISGWGVTDTDTNRKSVTLQEAPVPYQTNESCNLPESYNDFVRPSMFCAGEPSGGADACTYDSGGPATTFKDKVPILVGLVSFGEDCGRPKKFGVYTRIFSYRRWILRMMASGKVGNKAN